MENIYRLKEYYKRVCSPLVFVNETSLENNKNVKVYLYDFKTEEELSNFKKVFQEYLPFYVRNYDSISKYKISDDDEEISKMLVEKAKYIKFKSGSIPNRGVDKDGIYGEIYNDFYIRNIIDKDRLISYLSRRSYERPRGENEGIDIVGCGLKNDKLEITFSEAKFMTNIYSAKNNLILDTQNHLDKDFINDFMNFVIQRQGDIISERVATINEKINEFNDTIEDTGLTFIEVLNKLEVSVKFIYFAIFNNEHRDILFYEDKIQEIINSFNANIKKTNIKNYEIEVVFIPTFNTSMDLKNKMEEWDE
mgnify:CR=1 FL=1